ncbi:MAG: hypothetical protein D6776_09295 [Planctomycetota bacterium]|nr:MAG: hypothetical protein D6776_09295 [Planctomycetota bacterium]
MDWAEALTEVLAARYIDDVQPTAIPDPAGAIDRVVNNLDYIRSATPEAARRLDRVRDALAQAFGPGTDLELLSLDSQGYGSFGEANGFAVLDSARGQVLIALSGYAE